MDRGGDALLALLMAVRGVLAVEGQHQGVEAMCRPSAGSWVPSLVR